MGCAESVPVGMLVGVHRVRPGKEHLHHPWVTSLHPLVALPLGSSNTGSEESSADSDERAERNRDHAPPNPSATLTPADSRQHKALTAVPKGHKSRSVDTVVFVTLSPLTRSRATTAPGVTQVGAFPGAGCCFPFPLAAPSAPVSESAPRRRRRSSGRATDSPPQPPSPLSRENPMFAPLALAGGGAAPQPAPGAVPAPGSAFRDASVGSGNPSSTPPAVRAAKGAVPAAAAAVPRVQQHWQKQQPLAVAQATPQQQRGACHSPVGAQAKVGLPELA
jgi:hypothetical protein